VSSRLKVVNRLIPRRIYELLRRYSRWPPLGRVDFGDLRRLAPISKIWGADRGMPVDRHYIERFLDRYSADIRGRTLEVGTNTYTRKCGGDRVTQSDVLHVAEDHPHVTIIADLANGEGLPSEAFDCVILTQTLQVIYDVRSALRTVHRILVPGGCLLATLPGISKISRYDMDRWGYFWSFTTKSARRLLVEVFPDSNLQIEAHGNVLAAIAFLHGVSATELSDKELGHVDPDYEVLITVRALKGDIPE
jgi:SAM-dependent methyltransferase